MYNTTHNFGIYKYEYVYTATKPSRPCYYQLSDKFLVQLRNV